MAYINLRINYFKYLTRIIFVSIVHLLYINDSSTHLITINYNDILFADDTSLYYQYIVDTYKVSAANIN